MRKKLLVPFALMVLAACAAPSDEVETPIIEEDASSAADSAVEMTPTPATRANAADRGVTFRATGNEPGWMVEVFDGDQIVVETNYGENRVVTPYVAPTEGEAGSTYDISSESATITLLVSEAACQDDMSGEEFEAAVTLTLNGETYHGCGESL